MLGVYPIEVYCILNTIRQEGMYVSAWLRVVSVAEHMLHMYLQKLGWCLDVPDGSRRRE